MTEMDYEIIQSFYIRVYCINLSINLHVYRYKYKYKYIYIYIYIYSTAQNYKNKQNFLFLAAFVQFFALFI